MDKLDVIILGATGFTGKYIVRTIARIYSGLKWGIAGRSRAKLTRLVDEVKELDAELSNLPILICDANDKDSLANVCKRTKLVVNCIGPYMETGYAVVEACIKYGAHYVDLTVELNYILDLSLNYHKSAEEANVLIIPACGLVSLVPVMGLMYLENQFSGILKYVECYINIDLPKEALYPNSKNCLMHAGSLDTSLGRVKNMNENHMLMKKMLPVIKEPQEMKRSLIHYHNGKFWFPNTFPDEEVAMMSQKYLHEKEGRRMIPFKMHCSSTFSIFFLIAIPFVLVFYVIIYFGWFRKLVSKHPRFFTFGYVSHTGPREEIARKVKSSMIFTAKGWSDEVKDFTLPANKSLRLEVTAYDAYQTTADAAVASSLTILKESSNMPKGGVVNCGAAFRRTNIVERLKEFGVKYDIIEENSIKTIRDNKTSKAGAELRLLPAHSN